MLLQQCSQRWQGCWSEITDTEPLEAAALAQDGTAGTSERALGLDDSVQRGRLDGLGQEGPDAAQAQQFDAQGHLVQRRAEHLGGHVSLQPAMGTEAPLSSEHHEGSLHQHRPLPSKKNSVSEPTHRLPLCSWSLGSSLPNVFLHSPLR